MTFQDVLLITGFCGGYILGALTWGLVSAVIRSWKEHR